MGAFENADRFLFLAWGLIIFAVVSALISIKNKAPYGRYALGSSQWWGPALPARQAWCLQEFPCVVWGVYFLFASSIRTDAGFILISLFLLHYTQRTFIFSFLIRGGKETRFIVFLLAFLFCTINGYLQCGYLAHNFNYELTDKNYLPFFIIGSALFFIGMFINIKSDHILRTLRKEGDKGYKMPRGFFFEHVSAANFLGEIIEWIGFSIACAFSLPSVAFAFSTLLIIGIRGYHHHRHYQEIFPHYPKNRKAVIPFLW